MNTVLAPLMELGEYEGITKALGKEGGRVSVSGCVDSQKLHMVFGTDRDYDVKLIVTYSDIKARELLEDCRLYCRESYFYPANLMPKPLNSMVESARMRLFSSFAIISCAEKSTSI